MNICNVPGCSRRVSSRYSRYCPAHKARIRRHGAPDQLRISKAELAAYARRARLRMRKNASHPVWEMLNERWRGLETYCRDLVDRHHSGNPGNRHERLAAAEVLKLADVERSKILETVLAIVMVWELQPQRFRSNGAFNTQLVRAVRGLSDMNFGERYHHPTGRVKRFYRDLPPRATAILAQWIIEALGPAAVYIARLERKDEEDAVADDARLRRSLSSLR